MITLVQFTLMNGGTVWVNPWHVATVRSMGGGTEIQLSHGLLYEVFESVDQVLASINPEIDPEEF
jgi:uncharacterized protein YlzI (FlbEa/FlbD family)